MRQRDDHEGACAKESPAGWLVSRGHAPRGSLRMGRPGKRGLSASYCFSYTNTLVESGWPLTDTPFDVTVIVLPSADSVFVPV
jgi:hypothetical protein